ncbi:MAG: helix-turn-helix transcriptional regulator [Zetaproteobacteria bacterium]|nr:helix-turn-helix transcriptional regulator [Zetaproteobacteria bacterium]
MKIEELVSKNTRRIRTSKGLSQAELAARSKLSIRFVSALENSSPNITISKMAAIAKGLNEPVTALLKDPKSVESSREFFAGMKHCMDIIQHDIQRRKKKK